jgi:hypothetical protein
MDQLPSLLDGDALLRQQNAVCFGDGATGDGQVTRA